MELTTFVRKPFTVEAVEITRDNIEELSPLIGTLKEKRDGTPYIRVNRHVVPNVDYVYIGFWMTKMEDNIRCYSKRVFKEQFVELNPDIQSWINFLNGDRDGDKEVVNG